MRLGAFRGSLLGLAIVASAGIASATVSIYMFPEDLARRAPLIIEGTVERVASGLDPDRLTLATYVTLAVDHVHRGPQGLEQLTLREPGGRYADLVHDVDAVPVYSPGERVFVFLEPGSDGALRTVGMFYGKYSILDGTNRARRDLSGSGRIVGRPAPRLESISVSDLVAVGASVAPRTTSVGERSGLDRGIDTPHRGARKSAERRGWRNRPAEYGRLLWDGVETVDVASGPRDRSAAGSTIEDGDPVGVLARFVALSPSSPTRWPQSDTGQAVLLNVERAGSPLGDGAAAVAEIQRAMSAWTDVSDSRLLLQFADDDYDYTASQSQSPAALYSGTNVILFGDPYGDIADPSGCSGVLAIGGYWRSGTPGPPVNGVSFYPALQMYVIFNNDFECFLGNPDNLAEVATHEIGHGLGLGHSTVPDAIMRSTAYGNRGPRLGDDDHDAAHCHYPHAISLGSPNGGESVEAGSLTPIEWSVTPEAGPDPGRVGLEYSTNGGSTWKTIRLDEANDGLFDWTVPNEPGNDVRVRVTRGLRADGAPSGYPSTCSGDASSSSFSIAPATLIAGSVSSLNLSVGPGADLTAGWTDSCSGDADEYAVYSGSLAALRGGVWDHAPVTCGAGTDGVEQFTPSAGDRYYLVAPLAGAREGGLGSDSSATPRPESNLACSVRESVQPCD